MLWGAEMIELYFLSVLETGSPKARDQPSCFLVKPLCLPCRQPSLHCVPAWCFLCDFQRKRELYVSSTFSIDISAIGLDPPFWTPLILIISLKALSPSTVTLEGGVSTYAFLGGHNSVCNKIPVFNCLYHIFPVCHTFTITLCTYSFYPLWRNLSLKTPLFVHISLPCIVLHLHSFGTYGLCHIHDTPMLYFHLISNTYEI